MILIKIVKLIVNKYRACDIFRYCDIHFAASGAAAVSVNLIIILRYNLFDFARLREKVCSYRKKYDTEHSERHLCAKESRVWSVSWKLLLLKR